MKNKKLPDHIGGYGTDSEFFKMTYDEFVDYCGGRLAIALFNGEFKRELQGLLLQANARGMKRQIELDNTL